MFYQWLRHAPKHEHADTTYGIDSGAKLAEFELLEWLFKQQFK